MQDGAVTFVLTGMSGRAMPLNMQVFAVIGTLKDQAPRTRPVAWATRR